MLFHALALLAAVTLPNVFSPTQLKAAEASAVTVQGTISLIASPFYADQLGFYFQQIKTFNYCSGYVAYSKGNVETIVTARHCLHTDVEQGLVDGVMDDLGAIVKTPQKVFFINGDVGVVTEEYEYPNSDVGIIQAISTKHEPYQNLSPNPTYRGEPLLDLGMPDGWQFSAELAVVSQGPVPVRYQQPDHEMQLEQYKNGWEGMEEIACVGNCSQGTSGAGLTDSKGQIAGILVAGNGSESFHIPAKEIKAALTQWNDHPDLRILPPYPTEYNACYIGPAYCELFGPRGHEMIPQDTLHYQPKK